MADGKLKKRLYTRNGPTDRHEIVQDNAHRPLHCCQRRAESRSQVAYTEQFVKFGHVDVEICERTDRQTNRHTNTLIGIL